MNTGESRSSLLPDEFLSPDEGVREKALLAAMTPPRVDAIPILRTVASTDPSYKIRYLARKALTMTGLWREYLDTRDGVLNVRKVTGRDERSRFIQAFPGLLVSDPQTAVAAIEAAVASGFVEVVPLLVAGASKKLDPIVASKAVMALGLLGGAEHEGFIQSRFLSSGDERVRASAVEALSIRPSESRISLMARLATDPEPQVAHRALKFLKSLGSAVAIQGLGNMANSAGVLDREAAVAALSLLRIPEAVPLLTAALSDDSAAVRLKAKQGLDSLGAAVGRTEIRDQTGHGTTPPSGAMPLGPDRDTAIVNGLGSADPARRARAVADAVRSGNRALLPSLQAASVSEREPYVLSMLLSALGRLGPQESVGVLIPFLKHPDKRVRANAVEAGLGFSPETRSRLLPPLLKDPSNRVVANALIGLRDFWDDRTEGALVALCNAPERQKRYSAIFCMAEIGGVRHLNKLAALARCGDGPVSVRAVEALLILYSESCLSRASTGIEFEAFRSTFQTLGIDPDTLMRKSWGGDMDLPRRVEVETALFDLSSSDPSMRCDALKILGFLKESSTLPMVRAALTDRETSVRYQARKALSEIEAGVRSFLRALPDGSHVEGPEFETLDSFRSALESNDPTTRLGAVERSLKAAQNFGRKTVTSLLIQRLQAEDSEFVLPFLVRQVGVIGGDEAAPGLLKFLTHSFPRVRANAVEAIEASRTAVALKELIPLLKDGDNRVQANAVMALYHHHHAQAMETLEEMLYSRDGWMKDSAIFAARKLGGGRLAGILAECLVKTDSFTLKIKIARSIAAIGHLSSDRDMLDIMESSQDPREKILAAFTARALAEGKDDLDMSEVYRGLRESAGKGAGDGLLGLEIESDEPILPREVFSNTDYIYHGVMEDLNCPDEDLRFKALDSLIKASDPSLAKVFEAVAQRDPSRFLRFVAEHGKKAASLV